MPGLNSAGPLAQPDGTSPAGAGAELEEAVPLYDVYAVVSHRGDFKVGWWRCAPRGRSCGCLCVRVLEGMLVLHTPPCAADMPCLGAPHPTPICAAPRKPYIARTAPGRRRGAITWCTCAAEMGGGTCATTPASLPPARPRCSTARRTSCFTPLAAACQDREHGLEFPEGIGCGHETFPPALCPVPACPHGIARPTIPFVNGLRPAELWGSGRGAGGVYERCGSDMRPVREGCGTATLDRHASGT